MLLDLQKLNYISCSCCYVVKLLLTSHLLTSLFVTFLLLSSFFPTSMHVYNTHLLPKVETCFARSGPHDDFLHTNIPSPTQLIHCMCFLRAVYPFVSGCFHISLESIQDLDSMYEKNLEKMSVSTKTPQGVRGLDQQQICWMKSPHTEWRSRCPVHDGINFRPDAPVFSLSASKEASHSGTSSRCHIALQKDTFWWLQMDGYDEKKHDTNQNIKSFRKAGID